MKLKLYLPRCCFSLLISLLVIQSAWAQAPVAQFNGSPIAGCAPLVVSYRDQSTGNPTSWSWNLGNGNTSVIQHPSTTYYNPGTYNVTLTVRNANGTNTIVKNQFITVYDTPTIRATVNVNNGCAPLTVQFTDNTTIPGGSVTQWLWDFGDGSQSTQQNPQHTYASGGTFSVSLTVTTSLGCTKSRVFTNMVTVKDGGTPYFVNSLPNVCTAPANVTFTDLSTGNGPFSYLWDFGDGQTSTQQNPVHTYTSAGYFDVTLIITSPSGCRDTLKKVRAVRVGTVVPDFVVPQNICAGTQAVFVNATTPVPSAVSWNFGDGTTAQNYNPAHVYANGGTYNVTLTVTYGTCRASKTKQVTIDPKPTSNITATPTAACQPPLTTTFSAGTNAQSVTWIFGDGTTGTGLNPTHTYTAYGSYTVTAILVNSNGCSDTVVKPAMIKVGKPGVQIVGLPSEECAPVTKTFSAITGLANDPIVSYEWTLANGVTSTSANPSQMFNAGIFPITVAIQTQSGCRDTTTSTLYVGNPVHAAFYANPLDVCASDTIHFYDQSTGNNLTYLWNFGDGTNSAASNPTHLYEQNGTFTVSLLVKDYGCKDSLRLTNYINIKPGVARFDKTLDCAAPFVFNFQNNSQGADTYTWNFGDGSTTSTTWNPSHTYASPGHYPVTLTVTNNTSGCTHVKRDTAHVLVEHPAIGFSQSTVCKYDSAVIFLTSLTDRRNVDSVLWDFGDGSPRAGYRDTIRHRFVRNGMYTVRAYVRYANGCRDTITSTSAITIIGPVANFVSTSPTNCLGTTITFIDSSIAQTNHPIVQWTWDYGDTVQHVYNAPPFNHVYSYPDIYSITLWVKDDMGCWDSLYQPLYLNVAAVKADFVTDSASCPDRTVRFFDLSTGQSLNYTWNFGDNTSAATPNTSHTYTNTGVYNVQLYAEDVYGCRDSITKPLVIVSPTASFTMSDTLANCPPISVQFNGTATGNQNILWDFGDGNTSRLLSPVHNYTLPGDYVIKFSAIGFGGTCSSTVTRTLKVKGPIGSFNYTPLSGCKPLTVNFAASWGADANTTWDFGNGVVMPVSNNTITYTYPTYGTYVPKMILEDSTGCRVPIIGPDEIHVFGAGALFKQLDSVICDNGNVRFIDTSQFNNPIVGYNWNFGDGQTSGVQNPVHNYTAPGIYNVSLIVQTQAGCYDTLVKTNAVRVVASPKIVPPGIDDGCIPYAINPVGQLLVPDTSAIRWLWNFGNGQTSTQAVPNPVTYATPGNYLIWVTATNSSGCKDSVSNPIVVHALPDVNAGADNPICLGNGATLTATGASTYVWAPNVNVSCLTCATTVVSPTASQIYSVTGTDVYGCKKSDSVYVKVFQPFTLSVVQGDTLCVGQAFTLSASGTTHYTWVATPGGTTYTGNSISVSPTVSTTYTVTATDSLNCFTHIDSIPLIVYPYPVIDAGYDTTINVGQTAILNPVVSADATSVIWTPWYNVVSSTPPGIVVRPNETTTYQLSVRNQGNCETTDKVTVNVICNGNNFFVPNTFTPNGDGQNDVFYPRGTGLFSIKSMRIFNRWGELVFQSAEFRPNDPSAGWNGTYKGRLLNSDTYVYVMEILCDNSSILVNKGNITLIR